MPDFLESHQQLRASFIEALEGRGIVAAGEPETRTEQGTLFSEWAADGIPITLMLGKNEPEPEGDAGNEFQVALGQMSFVLHEGAELFHCDQAGHWDRSFSAWWNANADDHEREEIKVGDYYMVDDVLFIMEHFIAWSRDRPGTAGWIQSRL